MKSILSILFITKMAIAFTEISIAVQPFGNVDIKNLDSITPFISKEYKNAKIEILKPLDLPHSAFYKPRNRYKAEKLLDYLDSLNNGKYYRVIGITEKDISTTKGDIEDWGIFGLGNIDGYSCVVSTFRLKKDGKIGMLNERLKRIIIHELGHTFGLLHCDWEQCVMADYKGTIRILENQWFHLCAPCRKYFKSKYK